jgi:AraC-like DNA-binding protein
MRDLALLLCGFSIFSAVLIAATHFRRENYKGQLLAQWMGILLLLALAGLQLGHFAYLQTDTAWTHEPVYRVMLFAVAPTFYLFSKPLLHGDPQASWWQLLHLLPVLVAPLLPFTLSLPLAFAVGAGYLLWLARSVYALREQRSHFRWELWVLGGVFVLAILVMLMGVSLPLVSEPLFFSLYASAIGAAFLLVGLALGHTPRLSSEVAEAAQATYAVSTLGNVDCEHMLVRLGNLMDQEMLFREPELDLPMLAERMQLTPHQLSELINTRLGKGFSRYIREYRVEAAEDLLLDKPSMPVLSVGMEVGFTSQSNFYEAFREITGMTPGQYRKVHSHTNSHAPA